jgi:hypothetical protein
MSTLFVLFLGASCTPKPEADGRIIVIDDAGMLPHEVEEKIGNIHFPEDTPAILRTIHSLPTDQIGVSATALMESEEQWQELRPRGALRRYFRQDLPYGPGVYVLVSREPNLLQVRFGRDIRLSAYNAGIASGQWYREQQRPDGPEAIATTVEQLAAKTKDIRDAWFLRRWAEWWASLVGSEIEDFLAPTEGLYTDAVLRNFVSLASVFKATGSSWRFTAFIILSLIFIYLVTHQVLARFVKSNWARLIIVGIGNVLILGTLLVGFASLALLSRGRIEDQLALQSMGLDFLSTAGFSPTLFSSNGGWWLAIPGAVIAFLGDVIESGVESDAQRAQGVDHVSFRLGWLAWACALYLLPMAIALAGFVVVIWNTGKSVASLGSESSSEIAD